MNCRAIHFCVLTHDKLTTMKTLLLPIASIILFTSGIKAQPFVANNNVSTNTHAKEASATEHTAEASATTASEYKHVQLTDVANNLGQKVSVCGKVYEAKLLRDVVGRPTLMNLGGEYGNERIEVRIKFNELAKFDYKPEKIFLHKNVCITGTISSPEGFLEMSLDSTSTRMLLYNALNTEEDTTKHATARKLKMPGKAYLFAGPDLDANIITHLKAGSVVIPEYSTHGWTYAKIVEKAGENEQPEWLYGFIRNQALGLNRRGKLESETKKILGQYQSFYKMGKVVNPPRRDR
jgi:hypothetical protein